MTRWNRVTQWLAYTTALLITLFFERLVLSRLPLLEVFPVLLPIALVAYATLEGPRAGAGFGIMVGVLMTVSAGGGFWRVAVCSAAGLGAGLMTRYTLRQDLVGHLLCCLMVLLGRMLWCVGVCLLLGVVDWIILLKIGGLELLWSMIFAWPIYLMFRFVCLRWGWMYYV